MPDSYDNFSSNKLDLAIERLTDISSDLHRMLAVHEQRLNQHEKEIGHIADVTIRDISETIDREVKKLDDKLTITNSKIINIQKTLWLYMGGSSVIIFFITWGQSLLKIFATKYS